MATPRIYAHRGASIAAPENTIEAYEAAREQGADGVELDVRRSADGSLVLVHDPTLPDGRSVAGTPADELPSSVPTLEAALDVLVGLVVNIEIKNEAGEPDFDPGDWVVDRVAVEIARRGTPARWLVSSFRPETVERSRKALPGVRTALLTYGAGATTIAQVAAAGHAAIHPWVDRVDETTVRRAHALGLAVNVWTCDDADRMRELMDWGVDGITTNVPDVALAVRRR